LRGAASGYLEGMLALTLALLMTASAQEPAAKTPPPVYDEKADAHAQIDAALKIAQKKNQRVLIQWGGNWCGWCIKLAHTFKSDPQLAKKLLYEYRVLHVDVGHMDKNQDLVKRFGADLTKGVPFLTVLDGQGKVLANQETGSLEVGDKHDPAKVLAFLEANQAEPQDAKTVLAGALARAKEAEKRVLLSFEAPW
jgi:thiol:disulfide interchange protein